MLGRLKVASVAAAVGGLCVVASSTFAQFPPPPGVTKDEVKCESGAGKALTKFVGSKSKCAQKCLAAQRKADTPDYSVCQPPGYTDPATNTCIFDGLKGAEAKARAAIVKGCVKDCPDGAACDDYQGPTGACATGNPFVTMVENNLDLFGTQVYCLESGNRLPGPPVAPVTPTKEEAKCEDGLSKGLVKFVGAKSKCYDKCNQNAFKGKIDASTNPCAPPASDQATQDCITKAEGKAVLALNKACFTPPAVAPSCYDGTVIVPGLLGRPNNAQGWVDNTEGAIDAQTPSVACGSPSGAFLN
jgi:hypothetical protein